MITPLSILDWKEDPSTGETQILVQWGGSYPEDATWEELGDIQLAYPELHLEDKVFLHGSRDEMNTEPEEGDDDLAEEEPIGPVKRIRPKRNKQKPKRLNGYQLY